jgi:hypothetical protein
MEKLTNQSPEYKEYETKILNQYELDQKIRLQENPNIEEWQKIDADSHKLITEYLEKFEYPTVAKYGRKFSFACWVLVQHCPEDTKLQNYYLKMMQDANEEESNDNMALLTDRILMYEGKPQLYGTQFTSDENGKTVLYKVADPENLEKRRAALGLVSHEEYLNG